MHHSVRAPLLQTLACAGLVLTLPAAALAASGSPVHVDPSSPVAKEYALPLATARGAPPESGQSGKLFGSGLRHPGSPPHSTTVATPTETAAVATPPPAPPASQQPSATTSTTTTAPRPLRHRAPHVTTVTLPALTTPASGQITPAGSRQTSGRATPAAYRVLRPGSGSGLLWMALAAVVVVALGSAGGLALRRRR